MEEETYLNPHAKSHQKLQEFDTNKPFDPTPEKEGKRSSKTLVYLLLAVVILSIGFLIFGLVVLRIKAPSLRLSNVIVRDLRYGPSSLNMTFIADISLHNMNFGRFEFRSGGGAALYYGNATFGAVSVPGGRVRGRGRRSIGAAMVVAGGSSPANYMNISRDIESNTVSMMSVAELRGDIRVMKVVKRWRTALMNCSMDLNLTAQAFQNISCR